jgi:glycosyltransferase involved in cell wall biosynthesis
MRTHIIQDGYDHPAEVEGAQLTWRDAPQHSSESRRLRPLLIAEAANPHWTSVPLVGWNLSRAIAARTNALVATQLRNREAFLQSGLIEGRDFLAIDNEKTAGAFHRLGERLRGGENRGWTAVTALASFAYYSFEQELLRVLGNRLTDGEFDLVHRITPLTPTSQSLIAGHLAPMGIPFVLGPLNGGTPWPASFDDVRRKERDWLTPIRELYRLMPAYRATRSNAAAIIVGSSAAFEQIPKQWQSKVTLMPENGIDPKRFPFKRRVMDTGPLRVAFIGRLVPYKGADVLLEAVAMCANRLLIEVVIIGDGPEREALEIMVAARDLSHCVRFEGWVEQEELSNRLADCHVLALPSVREFGGGVVLEAMALGLVPVVANHGGPPELIDEGCGIAVSFDDRESLVKGFAVALRALSNRPELIESMSAEAGAKVGREHTWEVKADKILAIYHSLLDGKQPAAVCVNPLTQDERNRRTDY